MVMTVKVFVNKIFILCVVVTFSTNLTSQLSAFREVQVRDSMIKANINGSFCNTMNLLENQKPAQEFDGTPLLLFKPKLKNKGVRNPTWSVTQGYGGACSNDCAMTSAINCSETNSSKFRVPVVFTVSTSTGCGVSTIPSQSAIDAQLSIMNDLNSCEGVPIVFYKSVSYLGRPTTGDMSTRYLNLGCTYNANSVIDVPNVVNIYIFSDTGNGSTGCNGFAYLPTGPTAPLTTVISRTCINGFTYTPGTLNCSNRSLGLSIVLIHEMGHIMGLYHTHNESNATKECPDGTNCCTAGDYICDTDADPDLSASCAGSGCDKSPNNCTSPCGTPYPTNINTENNIMSYSNAGNCRKEYSPCQNAKMVDALICARGPQLCDRNVNNEFSNGSQGTIKQICVGESAPTFNATSNCFKWMSGIGASATTLVTGNSSFTPTIGTGTGQLNNMLPGTYTWYLADINEINPNCRTAIQVVVLPKPGQAQNNNSNSPVNACQGNPFSFATNGVLLSNNQQMVGWLFNTNNPTSTTSAAGISDLISSSANGTTLNPITGNVIQSNNGSPLINLNNLTVNCNNLASAGGDGSYFLTPFVALGDAPVSCSASGSSSSFNWSNGAGGATIKVGPLNSCSVSGLALSNLNLTVTITSCSNGGGNVGGRIYRNCGSSLSIGTPFNFSFACGTTSSISFTLTQIQAIHPTYNPLTDELCINFINSSFSGALTLSATAQLTATYVGNSAQQLWNSNGKPVVNINAGNCFWGTPIQINCNIPSGSISVTESSGIANNDGIICSGASATLTASGGNSYLWSIGANTASIVVSPTLTTTYTVTPTNANGCTATTSSLISVNGTIVDNSENTGLGTLRDIFNCVPAAATITYQSGVGSELTSPLIIDKNVTIQGNGLSTTTLDFNMSSGICLTVQAGTTLTFKDITINMAGGTNGPVIENFGNLVLDNVRVISNASIGNPAVRNNSSGNVSLLNQTIIKQP